MLNSIIWVNFNKLIWHGKVIKIPQIDNKCDKIFENKMDEYKKRGKSAYKKCLT